jgi:hypothetical protein
VYAGRVRGLVVLALACGCDCWDADVRAGSINFVVENGATPETALGHYGAEVAYRSGCGNGHDDSGENSSYEAIRGASVRIAPVGGTATELVETDPGRYSGEGVGYAAQFVAEFDGVMYTYDAPGWLSATVAYTPGAGALVTIESAGFESTAVHLIKPSGLKYWVDWARDSITIPPAMFDAPGAYAIEIARDELTAFGDEVFITGAVRIRRTLPLQVE